MPMFDSMDNFILSYQGWIIFSLFSLVPRSPQELYEITSLIGWAPSSHFSHAVHPTRSWLCLGGEWSKLSMTRSNLARKLLYLGTGYRDMNPSSNKWYGTLILLAYQEISLVCTCYKLVFDESTSSFYATQERIKFFSVEFLELIKEE